jgi:hypothetical protein
MSTSLPAARAHLSDDARRDERATMPAAKAAAPKQT